MLNISLISSFFWHVKIVHFLCSNFQVFAGIFMRCPTCQRAHIYHFCSFCIRCHICHFPIAIWSQNLGIGTIFEPNLPLKTGCNKFQMESVKMKKATKTVAFRQLAIYCNIVDNQLLTDAENINWFVIYWYLVCFSLLFIWRGTNWGQNLYKNNTKKRKHNFLELSNSQNRMLTKRKRKNSLHSYHNLIPSSINSNPDSRCIECRLLEKRNYRFSLVSCIFKKVLNQTLYNFIMTDIG